MKKTLISKINYNNVKIWAALITGLWITTLNAHPADMIPIHKEMISLAEKRCELRMKDLALHKKIIAIMEKNQDEAKFHKAMREAKSIRLELRANRKKMREISKKMKALRKKLRDHRHKNKGKSGKKKKKKGKGGDKDFEDFDNDMQESLDEISR